MDMSSLFKFDFSHLESIIKKMHTKLSIQERQIGQVVKENQSIGTLVLQGKIRELEEKLIS